VLELRSISKSFPGVVALDDVSLSFAPGEIHALVGENGAGKSTLIKIVTGIYQPDAGQILYNGAALHFRSYRDSLDQRIGIVNQEIQVVAEASVAENIMLDKLDVFSRLGDPQVPIGGLSAAHKQLVQIARALSAEARVLLLDEPTSSITEHEAATLFGILRKLKAEGVAIVFVSHKFDEVYEIGDRVSVLRDGQHIGTRALEGLPRGELVKMMIGREAETESFGVLAVDRAQEVLRVEGLYAQDLAHEVSFSLCAGEILGFYGLIGAGRTELARLLVGAEQVERGAIYIRGEVVRIGSVAESLYKYNMGYVTENRKEEGLLLESEVRTNLGITIWERLAGRFSRRIDGRAETEAAQGMVAAMDIRTTGLEQVVNNLSGGNQQKVSIGKWLIAGCDILIVDEPTVGVDIGAKAQIHRLIWDLAAKEGKAIILISSDMPEIISLAGRILVFKDKQIVHEIAGIHERGLGYDAVSSEIGHHLN
jgi:ribose transport system ATP-binding protein